MPSEVELSKKAQLQRKSVGRRPGVAVIGNAPAGAVGNKAGGGVGSSTRNACMTAPHLVNKSAHKLVLGPLPREWGAAEAWGLAGKLSFWGRESKRLRLERT